MWNKDKDKRKTINNIRKAEGPTKTNLTLLFTPSNLGSQVVVEIQKSLAMVDSQLSVINAHVNKLCLEWSDAFCYESPVEPRNGRWLCVTDYGRLNWYGLA